MEHHSAFIYILHQVSFSLKRTPLYFVRSKMTNVVKKKPEEHKILDFRVIDIRSFGRFLWVSITPKSKIFYCPGFLFSSFEILRPEMDRGAVFPQN